MLNYILRFHRKPGTDLMIKWLISVVLLCLVGPIVLDFKGEMPITLQSFVILLCAIAFGWKVGLGATMTYIILGAAGLPVFAGYGSGIQPVFGMYGGFYFGFLASATICGFLTELEAFRKTLPAILNWFLGHAIIVFAGALWLAQLGVDNWQERIGAVLPGALIKSALGALTIQIIVRLMKGKIRVKEMS